MAVPTRSERSSHVLGSTRADRRDFLPEWLQLVNRAILVSHHVGGVGVCYFGPVHTVIAFSSITGHDLRAVENCNWWQRCWVNRSPWFTTKVLRILWQRN